MTENAGRFHLKYPVNLGNDVIERKVSRSVMGSIKKLESSDNKRADEKLRKF